jgi:hypothetical protein
LQLTTPRRRKNWLHLDDQRESRREKSGKLSMPSCRRRRQRRQRRGKTRRRGATARGQRKRRRKGGAAAAAATNLQLRSAQAMQPDHHQAALWSGAGNSSHGTVKDAHRSVHLLTAAKQQSSIVHKANREKHDHPHPFPHHAGIATAVVTGGITGTAVYLTADDADVVTGDQIKTKFTSLSWATWSHGP